MPYGIISDDLTGSRDVAGRLTRLGYCPIWWLRTARIPKTRSARFCSPARWSAVDASPNPRSDFLKKTS